jgi:cobalt-zinc-cadmium efflux system membrane fusion protein
VQQVEGETVVFVRSGDGRYHKRAVALGTEADGLVEITSGVREGEPIVTAGAFLLKSALAAPEPE